MPDNIYFITFYTDTKRLPKRNGEKVVPHIEQFPLFINSIKRTNANSRVIILTDLDSKIDIEVDVVKRFKIDYKKIMLERIRLQIEFLKENIGKKIIFLDTDILVMKNCSYIFQDNSFDIGITRENTNYICSSRIYNNGVIFVNNKSFDIIDYFKLLYKTNLEMDEKYHAWNGNEYAVYQILKDINVNQYTYINQIIIKIFDGSIYNYTPIQENDNIDNKTILHFKGNTKYLMKHYYNEYRYQR